MSDEIKNISEEDKAKVNELINEQLDRMGEVFSQCWESEEFKQAFIENPKAIFKEYGVNYCEDKEYVVIDSPKKTFVKVLPYDGVKQVTKEFAKHLVDKVEDIDDNDGKQIILDGWKYEIYQNTPDKYYISIPQCPEDLTPEELEMINGGCFFAVLIFVAETVAIATTAVVAAEAVALAVVAAAIVEAAVAATTAVAVAEGYMVFLTVNVLATANTGITGYFVTNNAMNMSSNAAAVVAWAPDGEENTR